MLVLLSRFLCLLVFWFLLLACKDAILFCFCFFKMLLFSIHLVTKSKSVICMCLHLGNFVHWRRLQTSCSDGLPTIPAPADAPLLAERKKPQAKIYRHRQLPWQTDPQSQCPSHTGGGHPCVRCIMLVLFSPDNHNLFQATGKNNR